MNILQAIYQFQTGGGSLQVATDLAIAARQGGHHVTLLAKDVPVSATVGAEQFFTGNKLWDGWRLWQRLQQESFDIVHVHDRYCSFLLRMLPRVPPSIQTNHIAYRNRRRLTRFADCVVGCSAAMDRHHAEFFGLPPERRSLIPNGVYFHPPDPVGMAQLRQTLPPHWQGRKLCLTVARLAPQKGHPYLLEAIAQIPAPLRQQWGFVWAGGGELGQQLGDRAAALGIDADLLMLGQSEAVPEWLALANAFVLPSLFEGLSLALMEAMAAGLPCLASDVDGNRELLRHDENGLLCPVADATALATALTILLKEEKLRERLGAQAQSDYWNFWTFDRTWRQYESLYQQWSNPAKSQQTHAYTQSLSVQSTKI